MSNQIDSSSRAVPSDLNDSMYPNEQQPIQPFLLPFYQIRAEDPAMYEMAKAQREGRN